MNIRSQIRAGIIPFLMILIVFSLLTLDTFVASSSDPLDTRPIGYEFLNGSGDVVPYSEGDIVHIWNNASIGNYYFNKTSGIQFTNHFEDYWTHNIFCAGYKDVLGEWIYDCNDALPFTWDIKTDNLTYVNVTGYRDKTVLGRTVRLGLRYHLKLDDNNLSVQLSVEDRSGLGIPRDLGFAWRVNNIKINGDYENDRIFIGNTSYNLSDDLNLTFTNLDESYYKLEDDWYVRLDWDNSLTYKVEVKNTSQYNAPVTLGINAGTLSVGQTKTTTLYWQDPPKAPAWTTGLADSPDPIDAGNDITYTATGEDDSGDSSDPYWLVVCDTDSIDGNTPSAGGVCTGNELCKDTSTNFDSEATCDYTTTGDDVGTLNAWGFLCGDDGRCSSSTTTTTTVNIAYGTLNIVDITYPINNSNWYTGNKNLTITANVSCEGSAGSTCGLVYAYARYNASASPDIGINTTDGDYPFHAIVELEGTFINSWDTGDANDAYGITTDGTNIWLTDITTELVYKYQMDGTFINSWDTGDADDAFGITTDGTNIWLVDVADDLVYKYQMDGTFVDSWDTGDANYAYGITTNGNNIWLVDSTSDLVYKYQMDGTFVNSWDTGDADYALGIATDRNSIWLTDTTDDLVYKYQMDGTFINSWDTGDADDAFGLTTDGTNIWIIDGTNDLVYKYYGSGNPQSKTITQGQSFTTNWTLNITSEDVESYLIDVNFTSSYGNALVPDNNTEDRTINLRPPIFGTLDVNITYPINNSNWYTGNKNLTITANVSCVGETGAKCGIVSANARYNASSSPDTLINLTEGDFPFYMIGEETFIDSWDTGNADNGAGITTDGTNIWIIDVVALEVYKYDMNGTYTNEHWDTGDADDAYGITTDGTNIWIVDRTDDLVYKHQMDGTFVDSWDTGGADDAYGITTDGTNIWLTDIINELVYKYQMDGTFVDSWDTGDADDAYGITTDGINIWLIDRVDDLVYKYQMDGTFIDSWDTGDADDAFGLTTDGTNIWIIDGTNDLVYKYSYKANPKSSPALSLGESFLVNWTLNVTSADVESYLIDINFTSSYGNALVPDNDTEDRTIFLNPTGGAPPVGDSCGCPASGDWKVDCSDNCKNLTMCDINDNTLILSGSGTFIIGADIYADTIKKDKQCSLINMKNDGNRLIIAKG